MRTFELLATGYIVGTSTAPCPALVARFMSNTGLAALSINEATAAAIAEAYQACHRSGASEITLQIEQNVFSDPRFSNRRAVVSKDGSLSFQAEVDGTTVALDTPIGSRLLDYELSVTERTSGLYRQGFLSKTQNEAGLIARSLERGTCELLDSLSFCVVSERGRVHAPSNPSMDGTQYLITPQGFIAPLSKTEAGWFVMSENDPSPSI